MTANLRAFFVVFCLPTLVNASTLSVPADTTSKDTTVAAKKKEKRDLPLKAERTIRLKTDEFTWMSLDVSPDGKIIVFDMLGDLFTVPITGGKAKQITRGLALDNQPRFSPDGKKIVFTSDRSGAENLWLLDVGFTVEDTTSASDTTGLKQLTQGSGAYCSPEWTPDGKYIVASKLVVSGLGGNHLWMYHIDGGSGIDLNAKEQNRNSLGAAFGPEGRYIYYSTKMGRWGYNLPRFEFQVAIYDRDNGETFQLTAESGGAIRPAISPDGKWLVYASRHDAKTGFRLRNLQTSSEQWLAYPIQRDDQESRFTRDLLPGYSFTPDSKSIIAAIDGKMMRLEIPSGKQTEIPVDVETDLQLGPRVHFAKSVEDGPVEVRQVRGAVLSPDGKQIAFTALNRLYIHEAASGRTTKTVEMTVGQFSHAWSPDGRSIAFITWSEADGGSVYRVSARGGSPQRISDVNAYYAHVLWSPDGKEIIASRSPWQQQRNFSIFNFIRGQGLELVRFPFDGGAAKKIAPLKGDRPHFADKPDRIYVYEGEAGLVSFRLDGTDRKIHAKVTGTMPPFGGEKALPADEVIMGNDGEHALVLSQNHIYRISIPVVGGDPPALALLDPGKAAFPAEKLTVIMGEFMNWGLGTKEAIWSIGNTVFRYNFDEAKAYADSVKVAKRRQVKKEEPKDEDEEEPTFEPKKIVIRLEMPRLHGKGALVLRGARILTMDPNAPNDGIINDGAIIVNDNRIVEVGPGNAVKTPQGAKEIEVKGKFLLPGFVDAHAHMWPAWRIHRGVVWEYLSNLAYGVLTTRDPQTSTTDVLTYSDMVETGDLVGPRVFHTGPGVFGTDQIKSLKEARRVMKRYAEYFKTNTIKQYVAGDRNTRQWIIMAAKEREIMPTTEGALDMKLDLTQIIDGYPGHEHSFPISPLYRDFVEFVAKSGTAYTPTLLVSYGGPWAENYYYETTEVHRDPKLRKFFPHYEIDKLAKRRPWFTAEEHVFKLHAEQAKKILEAGGTVCVGGHGQLQGLGYHWELWNVQSGGMQEIDALKCATYNGALAIGFEKDLGSLEKGKLADIIVLDKDPLENIRNSTSLRYVMRSGLLYNAETLDQLWPVEKKMQKMYWENDDPVGRK